MPQPTTSTSAPPPARGSQVLAPTALDRSGTDEAAFWGLVGDGADFVVSRRRVARWRLAVARRRGAAVVVVGFGVVEAGAVALAVGDEVTPLPNRGGLAPLELDGCPESPLRALEMGIEYCFPAGEPGSTCTPDGGPLARAGAAESAHTRVTRTPEARRTAFRLTLLK
jgi:hypothetical protein